MPLLDADFATYVSAARAIEPGLTLESLRAGLTVWRPRSIAKGARVLPIGDSANEAILVLRGLLRSYTLQADGSERTTNFAPAGSLNASFAGLKSEGSAALSVIAEEPSLILAIPCTQYLALTNQDEQWQRFARRSAERFYKLKAEREHQLLELDAAARRQALSEQFPGLEARVAARHIASYLGITTVHLSRLRRRQARRRAS